MENQRIRAEAKVNGVKLWEVAERVGVTDGNFSRRLRRELPTQEQERIVGLIHEIAREKEAEHGTCQND